ncbi:hypothetical protein JXB28_04810 [Candidatus Woesearchaeota archaeon]|nr:hypothetical protein [Candidatus Woesearchaeota archaeon]
MRKAWVVTVDMGYGHQRAAYPFAAIANERIITANKDEQLLNSREEKTWKRSQSFYEWISRITSLPVIGKHLFGLYDKLQSIADFYPQRDLSKPNLQTLYLDRIIRKKKLNHTLFEYVKRTRLPFLTTHFIPAIAAENNGVKDIYCVVTDTDINRVWLPKVPSESKITYLAPCEHAAKRLKQYGAPSQNIIMTGFPLPKENLGGREMKVLKKDLGNRLPNLDPKGKYRSNFRRLLKQKLGKHYRNKSNHRLTLTFMTGGAGAQKEIGLKMLRSLSKRIRNDELKINLTAGTRLEVAEYYKHSIVEIGLGDRLGKNLNILFAWNKKAYFKNFSYLLHTTDIIWTKPSEMSFYTALGIPIIIAPPIGAHEYYNKKWLMDIGSGFPQENPDYTDEWLYDWLESGRLAEAAFEGFLEAPKLGIYEIEKIIFSKEKNKT